MTALSWTFFGGGGAAPLALPPCNRPCISQLHWLPVRSRVQFKLCTLMHDIHNNKIPIVSLRHCTGCCDSNYSLRSSIICHYVPYHTCHSRAAYTFEVRRAGLRVCRSPTAWNRLPDHIRRQSTPATFRRHLKTFLFAEVFNTRPT